MAGESWSVLPTDLLDLVLFKLVSTYDLVRLTAVCKSWRQPVLDHLRRRPRLPWVISFDQEKLTKLDLYDPWFSKKSYSLPINNLLLGARVHASQHGWLVLSKQEPYGISFLFYNPFRNEIIELPVLDLNTKKHKSKAMFSNTPASPDCVFFVPSIVLQLDDDGEEKEFYMFSIYKDKKWTSIETTDCWGGRWHVRDVIYMDGKFYCMFENYCKSSPNLGIFNVALQEWINVPQYDILARHYRSMMEADGELLLVSARFDWNNHRSMIELWQFDRSEKTWTRAESLGDRVLFLNPLSFPSISPMAAVGEAKEFADTIVSLGLSGCITTYTCKDDQGHWTPHQTYDMYKYYWFPSSESTLWIDGPTF